MLPQGGLFCKTGTVCGVLEAPPPFFGLLTVSPLMGSDSLARFPFPPRLPILPAEPEAIPGSQQSPDVVGIQKSKCSDAGNTAASLYLSVRCSGKAFTKLWREKHQLSEAH